MTDATILSVSRLHEQGLSRKDIAHRLQISEQKVLRILITIGTVETAESILFRQGRTVPEIAARLNKSEKAVSARLPYTKGMYDAQYPTQNALRIRATRRKKALDT